jgi:cell division protease FtsH
MTTGAESDVQQLTEIAREMVGRWGMSERIGPVAVMPDDGSPLLHPVLRSRSEDTQRTIDREVHRLVDEAHRDPGDAYAAAGVSARPPDDEARAAA